MNIFFLDNDPLLAAEYQCDKHVVKMILESAQLLCTTHHVVGTKITYTGKFYRMTHKNHPCAKWVRQNLLNYWWLIDHAWGLLNEYTYRYDKIHKSTGVIDWCTRNSPDIIEEDVLTPPAQAMPDIYYNDDPVQAYRNYYYYDKRVSIDMRWTRRSVPDWFLLMEEKDGSMAIC